MTVGRQASATSRRSLLAAGALFLVLQSVHLVVRPSEWLLDPRWAIDNYAFSLIFLGPAVAGCAAWQGRLFARGRWIGRRSPRRYLGSLLVPVVALGELVFLAGLVSAVVVTVLTGAPFIVHLSDVISVLVAFLGIAAYGTAGFAVGSAWPNPVVAAAAALTSFSLTLAAWIVGLEILVRFGGASGGVLGLDLRWQVHVIQVLFWLLITGLSLLAAIRRVASTRLLSPLSVLLVVLLVGTAVTSSSVRGLFVQSEVPWTCDGSNPARCVPETYRRFLDDLEFFPAPAAVAADIVASAATTASAWRLDDGLLFAQLRAGRGSDAEWYLVNDLQLLYWPGCMRDLSLILSEAQQRAVDAIYAWSNFAGRSQSSAGDVSWTDSGVPLYPAGSAQARDFLGRQLAQLPACA